MITEAELPDGGIPDEEQRGILDTRLEVLRSLPPAKQNAAILEEIVTLTFTLQSAILKLRKQTREDIKKAAEAERVEQHKIRRRTISTIVTAVLVAFVFTFAGDNLAIKHCFLDSGSNPSHNSFCNVVFPGYNSTVDKEKVQLSQFKDLVQQIPQNQKSIHDVNVKLDRIERQLARLNRGKHG